MTNENTERKFVIQGHVQGVGFRYATRDCALKLGIFGWVRNRPDGAVETCARGSAQSMTEFERWLNQGPRHARVDRCDSQAIDADEPELERLSESDNFSILR